MAASCQVVEQARAGARFELFLYLVGRWPWTSPSGISDEITKKTSVPLSCRLPPDHAAETLKWGSSSNSLGLTAIDMRIIGFLGIALLAIINLICLAIAVQHWDWRGIAAMLFMAGLLVFFGHVLWRGAKLEKRADCGEALVEGWAGQPVGLFFKEQVAKSIEGRVLIAGSIACVLMAMLSLLAPSTLALTQQRAGTNATLFAMWPMLAFVGYVKVCGPKYVTSVFSVLATFALVAAPFVITYT